MAHVIYTQTSICHIVNFEFTGWVLIQNLQYENIVNFVFTPRTLFIRLLLRRLTQELGSVAEAREMTVAKCQRH